MIKLSVLSWGDLTGLSGGPNVITRSLQEGDWRVKSEKAPGHRSRGMQVASGSEKRKEWILSFIL